MGVVGISVAVVSEEAVLSAVDSDSEASAVAAACSVSDSAEPSEACAELNEDSDRYSVAM